jgi:Zn/Cd-binding protein ZinT
MIDSHCHLNFNELAENFHNIINNSKLNNITSILSINTDPKDFEEHLNLIKNFNSIYLSYGVKIIDRHDDNAVIIHVSRKVAQLLGFYKSKLATVRVEILSDASKQWKSVANSLNEENFDETISSAPTDIVSIEEIDEILETNDESTTTSEEPIEIKSEKITDFKLYLRVKGFENYEGIRSVLDNYNNNVKYTSEKNNSKYDVIIGPLENTEANNLVSYFISKGYKETEILIE